MLRQIKLIIYRLKRQYGLLMYIKYPSSDDVYNLETGAIVRTLMTITIRKGIVLPQKTTREFAYDLSFIAANKNFTYGGFYDPSVRNIIIDAKDLPTDFVITGNMYVVFDSRRYEIKENHKAENGKAWLLQVKQISASDDD